MSPSGVSRQAQSEAAEESEHQCQLVPVLSGDGCHPAVHHRAGKHPAALCLQGQFCVCPTLLLSRCDGRFNSLLLRLVVFLFLRMGPCPRCPSLRSSCRSSPNLPSLVCQSETLPWRPCKSSLCTAAITPRFFLLMFQTNCSFSSNR